MANRPAQTERERMANEVLDKLDAILTLQTRLVGDVQSLHSRVRELEVKQTPSLILANGHA